MTREFVERSYGDQGLLGRVFSPGVDAVMHSASLLSGAVSHQDIEARPGQCGLVGTSAGSLLIFKGAYRAVLINYPNPEPKDGICRAGLATYSSK